MGLSDSVVLHVGRLADWLARFVTGELVAAAIEQFLVFFAHLSSFGLCHLVEDVGADQEAGNQGEHDSVDDKDPGVFTEGFKDAWAGNDSSVTVGFLDLAVGSGEVWWAGTLAICTSSAIEALSKAFGDFGADRHEVRAHMLGALLSLPLDLDDTGIALEGVWDLELLSFILNFSPAAWEGAVLVGRSVSWLDNLECGLSGGVSDSNCAVACWRWVHNLPGEHVSGAWGGFKVHSARIGATTWLKWCSVEVEILPADWGE